MELFSATIVDLLRKQAANSPYWNWYTVFEVISPAIALSLTAWVAGHPNLHCWHRSDNLIATASDLWTWFLVDQCQIVSHFFFRLQCCEDHSSWFQSSKWSLSLSYLLAFILGKARCGSSLPYVLLWQNWIFGIEFAFWAHDISRCLPCNCFSGITSIQPASLFPNTTESGMELMLNLEELPSVIPTVIESLHLKTEMRSRSL